MYVYMNKYVCKNIKSYMCMCIYIQGPMGQLSSELRKNENNIE